MKVIAGYLLSFFTFSALAADFRMLTDIHPPLQFMQDKELVGFGVDVVKEISRQTGDTILMEQHPWLRALHIASTEPNAAVFTILRTPEREAQYQWVGPLMDVETALFSRRGSKAAVHNLQQAGSVGRIALPRKWLAYDYLKEQGLTNLYGVETAEQMMRLLRIGRTDLVVADTVTLSMLANEAGLERGELHYQMSLMKKGTYIAFSLTTDVRQVARWQHVLDNMKRDGRLSRLKQQWLLDDF